MIKDGKLLGLVNIVDLAIILFVLLGVSGLFLVKTGKFTTSAHVIKKEAMIEFDVSLRGVRLSKAENLFKPNDKTFITIRNVPYTSLNIDKVETSSWQTVIPDPQNRSQAIAVSDPTEPYTYNYVITLKDKALVTADGPVIGGNKIKTGLPVTLEGYKYRLNGVVTDVRQTKIVQK